MFVAATAQQSEPLQNCIVGFRARERLENVERAGIKELLLPGRRGKLPEGCQHARVHVHAYTRTKVFLCEGRRHDDPAVVGDGLGSGPAVFGLCQVIPVDILICCH